MLYNISAVLVYLINTLYIKIRVHCRWQCKSVQPLCKLLKKLRIELPFDTAIILLHCHFQLLLTHHTTEN